MHAALRNHQFFVKEHVGLFKAARNWDIFDPMTLREVTACREPDLGVFTKSFRFTDYRRLTPFSLDIRTLEGQKLFTMKHGISLILSTVDVLEENERVLGHFSQKFFSVGGKFEVLDAP